MKTATIQSNKKIFLILVFSIAISILLYMYFINRAVMNIVEREKLSSEINSLQAHVAELESNYAALKSTVTLSTAYSLGFREVSAVQFIERRPLSSVSLNTLQ
jgi:outer membrane murein-binding lipoprotein Lpp